MKVTKRDGRIQEFDINKIMITLQRAAEEIEEVFTGSDINNISKAIEEKVKSEYKGSIHVEKIQEIVLEQLREYGFNSVAGHYEEYSKNLYNK
jgi:transcriptional regulator NrdR family protein